VTNANGRPFQADCFVDCGATGEFYDTDTAHKRNLNVYELQTPLKLDLVDGTPADEITHAANLHVDMGGHSETITFLLTNLGKYELLLGKP